MFKQAVAEAKVRAGSIAESGSSAKSEMPPRNTSSKGILASIFAKVPGMAAEAEARKQAAKRPAPPGGTDTLASGGKAPRLQEDTEVGARTQVFHLVPTVHYHYASSESDAGEPQHGEDVHAVADRAWWEGIEQLMQSDEEHSMPNGDDEGVPDNSPKFRRICMKRPPVAHELGERKAKARRPGRDPP